MPYLFKMNPTGLLLACAGGCSESQRKHMVLHKRWKAQQHNKNETHYNNHTDLTTTLDIFSQSLIPSFPQLF